MEMAAAGPSSFIGAGAARIALESSLSVEDAVRYGEGYMLLIAANRPEPIFTQSAQLKEEAAAHFTRAMSSLQQTYGDGKIKYLDGLLGLFAHQQGISLEAV